MIDLNEIDWAWLFAGCFSSMITGSFSYIILGRGTWQSWLGGIAISALTGALIGNIHKRLDERKTGKRQ